MIDRYTKSILTIIAGALAVIALQAAIPSAFGSNIFTEGGCGEMTNPCYVTNSFSSPLHVSVN